MKTEKTELIKFSSKVRELLLSDLGVSVGNMEVLVLGEKLYKLVRARAYNEGITDSKNLLERKMFDLSEHLDLLMCDEK